MAAGEEEDMAVVEAVVVADMVADEAEAVASVAHLLSKEFLWKKSTRITQCYFCWLEPHFYRIRFFEDRVLPERCFTLRYMTQFATVQGQNARVSAHCHW